MTKFVFCECGRLINENLLSKHRKTKYHQTMLKKKTFTSSVKNDINRKLENDIEDIEEI
jgi:hypothetical protein